jgi:hypothetical protein
MQNQQKDCFTVYMYILSFKNGRRIGIILDLHQSVDIPKEDKKKKISNSSSRKSYIDQGLDTCRI